MRMLEAGRELDALVAEKVMGWKLLTTHEGYRCNGWLPPNGPPELNIYGIEPPNYSADIAAAWEVVALMRSKGWLVGYDEGLSSDHSCCVLMKKENDAFTLSHEAFGESAPHAICHAALRAVGEIK